MSAWIFLKKYSIKQITCEIKEGELEKARLLLQERDKEIEQLKEQKGLLKEMLALMKIAENPQSQ
jgi:hypothetical protein